MLVRSDVSIHQYDDSRWVLSTPLGNHFVVNNRSASLFRILRESGSWDEAFHHTQNRMEVSIERSEFRALVREVLGGKGLLRDEEEKEHSSTYLRFRQPILPPTVCGFLARIFPPVLFHSVWFWGLFAGGALATVALVTYVSFQGPSILDGSHYAFAPVLLVGGMLAHELGHIAACRAKGVSHGAIGFGLYFFYPVMYADITDVWRLPRSDRLIANLSGIYGELLYAATLFGLYGLFRDGTYLLVASAVATSSAYQLNPFVRRDGYWVLSDALCIPNLVLKSKTVLFRWGHWLKAMGHGTSPPVPNLSAKSIFLFAYGVANSVIIFLFIGLMGARYGWDLIYFPITVFEIIGTGVKETLTWDAVRFEYLLFLAVYGLATRYLLVGGRSVLRRIRSSVSNAG